MAVTFETHPDHAAFLDVLDDPRLHQKGVDLGNLGQLRRPQTAAPQITKDSTLPPYGDPEQARVVLVLGMKRTGSNFLFGCLDQVQDFYTLREVFNAAGAFGMTTQARTGLRHFGARLGVALTSERDAQLCDHLHENPIDTITQLRGLAAGMGRSAVALKIFNSHIDDEILTESILADPDVVPVILKRELLLSYISLIKARNANAWTRHDLTAVKPEIDIADYLDWQSETINWYQMLENALKRHGRAAIQLTYADFMSARPRETVNGLLEQLQQANVACGPVTTDFDPPIPRQDHTENPFDRIANGDILQEALRKAGQLSVALHPPMTR